MGIPLFSLSEELKVFESSRSDVYAFTLFDIIYIVDVIRMLILIMVIPKLILKPEHDSD